MTILNINNLNLLNEGAKNLLNKCNGVECCPESDDSGWGSCPESDLTS